MSSSTAISKYSDYSSVPNGIKNDAYCVLQNEFKKNGRGKGANKMMIVVFGTQTASTKLTNFIMCAGKFVFRHGKKEACMETVKGTVAPIEPQLIEVIHLKRYYATLKRDPSYTKHVSWFEVLPTNAPNEKEVYPSLIILC